MGPGSFACADSGAVNETRTRVLSWGPIITFEADNNSIPQPNTPVSSNVKVKASCWLALFQMVNGTVIDSPGEIHQPSEGISSGATPTAAFDTMEAVTFALMTETLSESA